MPSSRKSRHFTSEGINDPEVTKTLTCFTLVELELVLEEAIEETASSSSPEHSFKKVLATIY